MSGASSPRMGKMGLVVALCVALACGDDDSGSDSGPGDASMVCTTDEACDDGEYCNGPERCAPEDALANALGCVTGDRPCALDQGCDELLRECTDDCMDGDGDGVAAAACGGADCDDANPNRHPGATEVCDDVDDDCDPRTFGGYDIDGDGFVRAACCNDDGGTLFCGEDCNDNDRTTSPTSPEVCDGRDNDCDGDVDEGVLIDGFVDADFDLHGDPTMPLAACAGTAGWSPIGDDCNDDDRTVFASVGERSNGLDDDCDGAVDEDPGGIWYRDQDDDGFGSAASGMVSAAAPPVGYVALDSDCDDDDPEVHPGATELCNARDDDCNGRADFAVDAAASDFEDDDLDGSPDLACGGDDCDDDDPFVGPEAAELLDGIDNDCDGGVDDRCDNVEWYLDADDDGYGDDGESIRSCETQVGRVPRGGDCDDAEPARNPSAREECNAVDDDCDGSVDELAALSCLADHALGTCNGSCVVSVCELGYADCDGDELSCEVSIRSDPLSCGGCGAGFACTESGPNSRPDCVDFVCGLACDMGFSHCDADLSNGCEIRSFDDPLNCGGCGIACDEPVNGAATCTDATCGAACDMGFDDCNGDLASDGCETETGLDVTACGTCGNMCGALQTCAISRCVNLPYPSDESAGDELIVTAAMSPFVMTNGVHQYRRIVVESSATVRASGTGVLELYASEDIVIDGTIDVSGGRGANARGSFQDHGGGGDTGTATNGINSNNCNPAGLGGSGLPGQRGTGTTGTCGQGGNFGGGSGGDPGGGGGGFGGGGGGGRVAAGGNGGGGSGGLGGISSDRGGKGGVASGVYVGEDGGTRAAGGCGGGGSIGATAAGDLQVATTFQPGSGGGGGAGPRLSDPAGGGGGGGGALRLAAASSITIGAGGALFADGGNGGNGGNAGGAGGAGSGGVVFLSAPRVTMNGQVDASGGLGGSSSCGGDGGMGRIRISVDPRVCAIGGSTNPPTTCADTTPTAGRGYVGDYPD